MVKIFLIILCSINNVIEKIIGFLEIKKKIYVTFYTILTNNYIGTIQLLLNIGKTKHTSQYEYAPARAVEKYAYHSGQLIYILSWRIHETCDNDISLGVFLRIPRDMFLSCE